MTRFDWPQMLRIALFELRLKPAEFWALTPAEFRIMLGQGPGAERPMSRSGLEALLAAYPDQKKEQVDDGHG